MGARYEGFIARKAREYGDKFDHSDLDSVDVSIRTAYETRYRVRVASDDGFERDGYIGVTTGWKPSFLLLWNRRSLGSSVLIHSGMKVVKTFNTKL